MNKDKGVPECLFRFMFERGTLNWLYFVTVRKIHVKMTAQHKSINISDTCLHTYVSTQYTWSYDNDDDRSDDYDNDDGHEEHVDYNNNNHIHDSNDNDETDDEGDDDAD
eukprot:7345980-Karenia_brevis.AAC.1